MTIEQAPVDPDVYEHIFFQYAESTFRQILSDLRYLGYFVGKGGLYHGSPLILKVISSVLQQ